MHQLGVITNWVSTIGAHRGVGQEAKCSARIGHRSFSPSFDAWSLTVFELAGLRPPLKEIGISPHPLAPYPWDSSFFLGRWALAEEAELIGEEQEVWGEEIVAATWKEKTYSGQVGAEVAVCGKACALAQAMVGLISC